MQFQPERELRSAQIIALSTNPNPRGIYAQCEKSRLAPKVDYRLARWASVDYKYVLQYEKHNFHASLSHNSAKPPYTLIHHHPRPQFFYNSISIFFYNVLHPPHTPRVCKLEKYFDFGDLKTGSAVNEVKITSEKLSLQEIYLNLNIVTRMQFVNSNNDTPASFKCQ